MKTTFNLYSRNKYDEILNKLKQSSLNGLNHKLIFRKIMKDFDGIPAFVLTFDERLTNLPIYRVTKIYSRLEENLYLPKSFSYPRYPQNDGRANLKNHPVFYGSISARTAVSEMKNLEDNVYYVSKWNLKFPKPVQAHILMFNIEPDLNSTQGIFSKIIQDSLNVMTKDIPDNLKDCFRYKLKIFGDLFTQEGQEYYHLTSAIAHTYLYDFKKIGALAPILIYPSVTHKTHDFNLALHPELADNPEYLEIQSVLKCNLSNLPNNRYKGNIKSKAILKYGKLDWKNQFNVELLFYTKAILIKLVSEKESRFIDPEGVTISILSTDYDFKDFIINNIDHFKNQFDIGHILGNHDIFNNDFAYIGTTFLKINFENKIYFNFNNCLEYFEMKVNYNLKFN